MNALLELCRHKTWATLRLIEYCRELSDDRLDLTIPGTYGTIRQTLRHMMNADADYFSVLTGELFEPLPDEPIQLDELTEYIRRTGPRREAMARDLDFQGRKVTFPDGISWQAAVVMAQAIHHADDHRTHILSILGAHGLEVPRLDVWAYAFAANLQL